MDMEDLKSFMHLAETLHFGRTAQALHRSTSAITRTVQRLEEELGHPLFIRDRRQVALSAAGRRVRAFAQVQVEEWERLRQDLAAEWVSPQGDVSIASTVTACYSLLPRLVAECRRRFPKVALKLVTQDAGRSLQQLESGEVDLAVVPTEDADAGPQNRVPLAHTDLVFIAPLEGPVDPLAEDRLLDGSTMPLVAAPSGLDRLRLEGWFAERGVSPAIAAEVRGNEAIIAMVSMGAGIALVPVLVLEASPMQRRVRRLPTPPPPGYTVSLCGTDRSLRRRAVEVFWELAVEAC